MKLGLFQELRVSVTNAIGHIRSRRLWPAILLILCCAEFIVRAYSGTTTPAPRLARSSAVPRPAPPAPTSAAPGKRGELVTTLKFNIFDVGIYPRELHASKGLIAITIEDYSGGSPGVIVDRETGGSPQRAGRVDREGTHWRSRGELRLGPGRYRVYMADRPANQALLVVEP
jgi:hypothetical protein